MYLHSYLMLTSVAYFRGGQAKFKTESRLKANPVSTAFLFFLDADMHYHMITIFALIGRIDILLFFYAIYFNLIWMAYFLFYLFRYLKYGDAREA
jgi:hypothetical protein